VLIHTEFNLTMNTGNSLEYAQPPE
jgi:hypothetical protein